VVGRDSFTRVIIDLYSPLLMVVGIICGVFALFGIGTHGKRGILRPSVVGIVLNVFLLFIFVTNFMAARANALRQPGHAPSQIVPAAFPPTSKILATAPFFGVTDTFPGNDFNDS
jgi:hypothetical protein